MASRGTASDLLAEALELLSGADRMHRQFFTLTLGRSEPSWTPPIDVIEGEHGLEVRVALPGVPRDAVEVRSDGRHLFVVGRRPLRANPGDSIHCLELPYGRFERRIELPEGRYELAERDLADGLLVLTLRRIG